MVETKIESASIDPIQMYSKHLHVCFVTKSHTLWANSSHHSKLVVICLHDVYIVYILCTADNVLFWQLSSHYHLKIHSGGHNFVSKYYILCLKEIPTKEKKSITQSQLIDYWKHDFVLKTCFLVVTCHLLTFVVIKITSEFIQFLGL